MSVINKMLKEMELRGELEQYQQQEHLNPFDRRAVPRDGSLNEALFLMERLDKSIGNTSLRGPLIILGVVATIFFGATGLWFLNSDNSLNEKIDLMAANSAREAAALDASVAALSADHVGKPAVLAPAPAAAPARAAPVPPPAQTPAGLSASPDAAVRIESPARVTAPTAAAVVESAGTKKPVVVNAIEAKPAPAISAAPGAPAEIAAKVESAMITAPMHIAAPAESQPIAVSGAVEIKPAPAAIAAPSAPVELVAKTEPPVTIAKPAAAISAPPAPTAASDKPAIQPPQPSPEQKPWSSPHISVSHSPPPEALSVYQQAQRQITGGDFGGALETLRQTLAKAPDDVRARLALADVYMNLGQQDKTLDLLREGLRRKPGEPELTLFYAKLLAESGDSEQAMAVLNNALAVAGGHNKTELREYFAALSQQMGDYAQAERSYRLLLQQQSDNGAWLMGLGIAMQKQRKNTEALEVYRQALYSGGVAPPVQRYISEQIHSLEHESN